MKNIIMSLAILWLPLSLFAQSPSIDNFYNKYEDIENVTAISLSGDLLNILINDSEDEMANSAGKISKLRLLIMDESNQIGEKDYKQFLKSIKKDDFEELIRFKDEGASIDFHLREEGAIITNVLITINGKDGFILLNLEGRFNFSDLNDLDLNIEGAKHLKKLPEKRKNINRA